MKLSKNKFNLTLKLDPFIDKLPMEPIPPILATSRYIAVTGFSFCDMLDGSSFDTMTPLSAFHGNTLAEENPDLADFINVIDDKAYTIFQELMRNFHLAHQIEAKRMSCYVAAEGTSVMAGLSRDRLLKRIDPQKYFKDIIPAIVSPVENVQKRRFKIAYLLMVHEKNGFRQLCSTLELLDDGDGIILIHVDAKSQSNELFGLLEGWIRKRNAAFPDSAIFLAKRRFSSIWGHISLVFTQLSGFWELLDMADWDYILNISNYDYPLKSNAEIHEILSKPETKDKNFIEYWTDTSDLSERFNRVHLGEADYSSVYHPPELGIISSPYQHWRAYKHHQWVIFTPETVRFFRKDPDALNFLAFTEHTYIPDEHFFGTVLINSPEFHGKVINNNKRYLRFTGGAHPAWLGYKDRHLFPANEPVPSFFFIRKLNSRGELFGEKKLIEWIHAEHYNKKSFGGVIPAEKCTVEKMSYRSECLKKIGSTIAIQNSVIIIPVNTPYLATAKNLACSLARLNVKNVIFWALDLDVYETLLKQDKLVILLPGLNPLPDYQARKSLLLKKALRSKSKLVKFVLESGLSAWIVDADVVAVQDFTAIQDPTTDIFVSFNGQAVSSSVVFYRSNNRTLGFVSKLQAELDGSSSLDDEDALRRVILKPGAAEIFQANHEDVYHKVESGIERRSGDMKLATVSDPVKIRYLDPFSFISSNVFLKTPEKIPQGFTDYYTLHIDGENAKSSFKPRGYWFVDDEGYCLVNPPDPPPLRFEPK